MNNDKRLRIGNLYVPIDLEHDYDLYGSTVTGVQLLKEDFDHLPETHALALQKHLIRTNEVQISFHPHIIESLLEEQENSPFYKKTPDEIKVIYKRTGTKDLTKQKEENQMKSKVDITSQVVRNRRTKAVNRLVELGYDRSYSMEILAELIEETDTGIMNLTPTRIADLVDERINRD